MRSSAIKVKGEGFPVHVRSYREYRTHLLFSFSRPYLSQPCTKSAAVRALGFERHRRYHQAIHSLSPSPPPPLHIVKQKVFETSSDRIYDLKLNLNCN